MDRRLPSEFNSPSMKGTPAPRHDPLPRRVAHHDFEPIAMHTLHNSAAAVWRASGGVRSAAVPPTWSPGSHPRLTGYYRDMLERPPQAVAPNETGSQALWAWVLAITALALLLRVFRIDYQSLWYDELFSFVTATQTWGAMLDRLIEDFVHPPLHSFALFGVFQAAGVGSLEGRLLSALFGTAAVPIIYLTGRQFFDSRSGIVAAALMAVSQLGIMYSQELRPYAQQLFFVSLTLWFFGIASFEQKRWAWWAFVVAATLAIYTHYYSVLLIGPLFAWALVDRRRIPLTWTIGGAVCAALLFVPWLMSGVVEAALSSPKTTIPAQPGWFATIWTTPFDNLNQYNNGGVIGVLERVQPSVTYFIGAFLFTTPALVGLSSFDRLTRAKSHPAVSWAFGAAATLAFSFVADGATSGLALVAVLLARGAQLVARQRLAGDSRFRPATTDVAWGVLLALASGVAYLLQAPAWILFVLGLLVGSAAYPYLLTTASPVNTQARTPVYSLSHAQMTLGLAWIVPFIVPLAMGLLDVQYDVRYTLAGLPPYLILVAHGLSALRTPPWRPLVLTVCAGYSLLALRANYFEPYKENWRDVLSVLSDRYTGGDCVAILPWDEGSEMPLAWGAYGFDRRHPNLKPNPVDGIGNSAPRCARVWVLSYSRVPSARAAADSLKAMLRTTHRESEHQDFFWTDIGLYERRQ